MKILKGTCAQCGQEVIIAENAPAVIAAAQTFDGRARTRCPSDECLGLIILTPGDDLPEELPSEKYA